MKLYEWMGHAWNRDEMVRFWDRSGSWPGFRVIFRLVQHWEIGVSILNRINRLCQNVYMNVDELFGRACLETIIKQQQLVKFSNLGLPGWSKRGRDQGHVTVFFYFETPSLTLERLKLDTSNGWWITPKGGVAIDRLVKFWDLFNFRTAVS